MSHPRPVPIALLLALGCTPPHVEVRRSPADALKAIELRLQARDIALDEAGRRPDRLRTAHFCYVAPDRDGGLWDRSFARVKAGPIPFTYEGPMDEQRTEKRGCAYIFRVELVAVPTPEGARIRAIGEWWRMVAGACTPTGNPLVGIYRCEYEYLGATAPANAERFFYGVLTGL